MNTSTRSTEPCPAGCGPARTIGAAKDEDVFRCPSCGLMFYAAATRDLPASDDDWWATDDPEMVPLLRTGREDMRDAYDRQLASLEGMTPGRRFLDVGAGAGIFLACARDRGWDVVGFDKNPNAPITAGQAFGTLPYVADLDEIEDGSIDVMRLSHVLEHVAEPVGFLKVLRRKLAPGGILAIIVPNGAPLTYSAVNALRRIRSSHPKLAAPMSPRFHLLGLTTTALARLADVTGYEAQKITSISMGDRAFYPMFYDGLIRKVPLSEIPVGMFIRYWMPFLVDNLGNPFGKGQWLVAYLRNPAPTA